MTERWKLEIEEREKLKPENILLDKYTEYIGRLSRLILKPFAKKGGLINKRKITYLRKNVEKTLGENINKKTPDRTEDAYWNIRNLLNVLKETSHEELNKERKLINLTSKLGISCNIHGKALKNTNVYRNPCRKAQEGLLKELVKSKRSPLINSIEKFYNTCRSCPYK